MKKLIAVALVAVVVAAVSFSAACMFRIATQETQYRQAEYDAGFGDGIEYVIENAEIFTVERYDPENPEENARPDGTDQTIYIVLDGVTYEHGMYQG